MNKGLFEASEEGTPQGGPLSPLLSNIMLNELDKELERRGLPFVRYADDSMIFCKSKRAAMRVKKSISSDTIPIGILCFHILLYAPIRSDIDSFVKSMTRFNSFSFDDVDYTYCRQTKEIVGMMTPKGNPYARVTDVESTLLDCFDRIDRAGGIEELLHCMEGIVLLNEERLIDYLARYDKAFLYQKTGYLLERIKEQTNISESLLELCRAKGTKSVKWLTNNEESDTFVNKWRMYVPQELTSKERICAGIQ